MNDRSHTYSTKRPRRTGPPTTAITPLTIVGSRPETATTPPGNGSSAARDDLTGVLRRGTGMLELQRDIDRSRRCGDPLVVAFLDVDDLKHTNDEHGHMAGDTALRTVAQALQTQMRSYDVIMRYGGDEFVCAQPGLTMTEAYERLLRVRARLSTAPRPVFVTFGLAELQPDDDLETLVARADAALYMTRSRRN